MGIRVEEELNVQSAYGGPAADRIKEILNTEKEERVGQSPTLQNNYDYQLTKSVD